jgi:hypothetical protein
MDSEGIFDPINFQLPQSPSHLVTTKAPLSPDGDG